MFVSRAQQEVGVEEEVTQAAFPLAHVHHKAVTHQLTPLSDAQAQHVLGCNAQAGIFMYILARYFCKPHHAVTEHDLSFAL